MCYLKSNGSDWQMMMITRNWVDQCKVSVIGQDTEGEENNKIKPNFMLFINFVVHNNTEVLRNHY